MEKGGSIPDVLLSVEPNVRHERLIDVISALSAAKCRHVYLLDTSDSVEPRR
jgi:biopolymer transport protein ExbD